MKALKAAWTVRVGMFPGEVEALKQFHKQWLYTSEDYEADQEATRGETPGPHPEKPPTIFMQRRDAALQYWLEMNEPSRLNWAELDFTWL